MADSLKPRDAKEVEAAVQSVLATGKTAEIVGHGSKRAISRALQTDVTLELSALSGVTLYEPEELVLSARAGTPLAEIEALVAAHGQQLAFEPMDYGPILGAVAGRGTIGGMLAANLSGPRRVKAGAARDHFLGFHAVSGRGETFKSGGRVVKNVTGYDLSKLIAGSWGTLAVLTEATIKTLPRPETEETVLIRGLQTERAIEAMTAASGSACDISGAAHLPAEVAVRIPSAGIAAGSAVTALRIEGFAPSVAHRKGMIEALLSPFGEVAALGGTLSQSLWRAIRDVAPFAAARDGLAETTLACFDGTEPRCRARRHGRHGGWRADPVRLGRGAGLGHARSMRGRWRRDHSPRRCGNRRTCDAHPGACLRARNRCRVRAAGYCGRGIDEAGQGKLRSRRCAQPRKDVGGGLIDADIRIDP